MSKILKFNENWFKKNKPKESKPKTTGIELAMGVRTIPRPEQEVNRLSDDELKKIKKDFDKKRIHDPKIDPYFLQELSDRLYGPDSEEYIEALKELNLRFRPRVGKIGHDIFKDEI
jgi:hypothetical protein